MKLNLRVIRRILALVLLTALSPFVSAIPQPALLEFSSLGISGSFGLKIDPSTQALLDISSVSLSIDGYKFRVKDVGFTYNEEFNFYNIGGLINGIDNVVGGSSIDFKLSWSPAVAGGYFHYTFPGLVDVSDFAKLTISGRRDARNSEPSLSAFSSESVALAPAADVPDSTLGIFALLPVLGLLVAGQLRQRRSA